MKLFKDLGLSSQTLKTIEEKGFEMPTSIQEKVIPAVLSENFDIVGQARTGTGKTAAFALPLIERLKEDAGVVQVLVLTPTRELAIQVAEEVYSLKGRKKLSIVPIYGGQAISLQLRSLKRGVDIVVGTPGRVCDHIRRNTLKLQNISYLILDEADEMLNMGFLEDVEKIMAQTSPNKRTMLFSATMPQEIMRVAKKYMGKYKLFQVSKGAMTVSRTDQIYFEVPARDKFEALCRIIDMEEDFYGLVFCRTKVDVDRIARHLIERGYDADALHGDMSQAQRTNMVEKFKSKKINILVATDVASRGLDVQNLTHVINFALPQDPESYVHRIGRTGRAGKEGNAITFITPAEYRKLQFIRRKAQTDIRKAKLPKIKDIIEAKKAKITNRISDIAKSELKEQYRKMSKELLGKNDPEDVLAAVLQDSFGDQLDKSRYSQIKDQPVDLKGRARLFVSQGKKSRLTKNKLKDIIKNKCGTAESNIQDIQIFDRFAFISLPFSEAEKVLAYFGQKKGRKTNLVIEKAKKKRSK
ncbi:MAG: DEAD/DEAH box helicase [Candidatus Omnitrophica bacterium]|nr:DEAD/DEAH box helicase [Candidatus Omnitrophota bacterium]MCF7896018.1 DEAD/DEAH box helicase [Candidatus Omnitrophota bacterium]